MTDSFSEAYAGSELEGFFDCPRPPHVLESASLEPRPRVQLAAALTSEANRLQADPAVLQHAQKLALPNSAAVVTGQQAGLLLGPNFTLSKSASASRLATRLDSEATPVVPVFWLASQDHDVAEIDHNFLLDLDEKLHRLSLPLPAGTPAGAIPWRQEWLTDLSRQIDAGRWQAEFRQDVQLLLEHASSVSLSWSDFFAALYYRVLGEDAPLVLDPGQPALAVLFRDILAREIAEPEASVAAINHAGAELRRLGYVPQLGRGRQATNLFITVKGPAGLPERQLLRHDSGNFHAGAGSWSRQDLLAILDAEPGRITPAAGLRPVVQDSVLPSAAFVVGPGELRYLAQLRDVYRQHGVRQPTIWPRSEVTLLEPPVRRILNALGQDAASYMAAPDEVEQGILLRHSGAARHFEQGVAAIEEAQAELQAAVLGLDPTLQGAVDRHAERVAGSVRLLRQKTADSLLRRNEVLGRQFTRLRQHLLPQGNKQERLVSPLGFILKFGIGPIRKLFKAVPESGRSWPEI